jgi:hypothetical protein
MHLFRLIIGVPLVAVGLVMSFVAVCLIAKSGDKAPYMYVVWGLGLLTMLLGFKSLPKKKKRRKSPLAGRSSGRPDHNKRGSPASEEQKSFARELGIEFPPSISKEDLSDLITEETGE